MKGSQPVCELYVHQMCAVSSFSMEHMLNELEAGGISCLRREEQGGMALLLADGASEREAVLKTLSRLKKAGCRVLVAVLGEEKYDNRFIWQMLLEGASDVWMWDELSGAVDMLKLQLGRWQTVERIFRSPKVQHNLIGQSEVWMAKIRQIVEIACYSQSAILIQGESGTGKELVARLIHSLDTRPDKDELVLVDCTTIVPELSGSEFFGHEKGAFTNAISTREGAFALANRGTLFLDEVGELPMPLQAELLRVIQEGTYKRVGSNQWRETRFRLVCATNRDLQAEIEAGNFRMDLYYRLANWVVHLPSLARRREDIPLLIAHFWRQAKGGVEFPGMNAQLMEYLTYRSYRGNVRELRQLVHRMAGRHIRPGPVSWGDLPEMDRPARRELHQPWQGEGFQLAIRQALREGVGLKEIKKAAADTAMNLAIARSGGNLRLAAKGLGVSDRTLQLHQASRSENGTSGERPLA